MLGMRLLKVDTLSYGAALRRFLSHPVWDGDPSFSTLIRAFGDSAIGYGGGLSKAFAELGYEVMHVVSNFQSLQVRWAEENGVEYSEGGWESEILAQQVDTFKPDVVLFQGMPVTPRDFKQRFPSTLITAFSGYPLPPDCLPGAEFVFCCAVNIADYYRKMGLAACLTHHSFDDSILAQVSPQEGPRDLDFTFLGSSGFNLGMASSGRYWMLFEMLRKTRLEAWLDETFGTSEDIAGDEGLFCFDSAYATLLQAQGHSLDALHQTVMDDCSMIMRSQRNERLSPSAPLRLHRAMNRLRAVSADPLPLLPLRVLFPGRCHGPHYGLDMFRTLAQSNIIFNRHTNFGIEKHAVGNMRLFEATGMGACLLTDMGTNLPGLFELDYEAVAYSSEEECLEKVGYLLNHPEKAREIGEAGRRRVMRDHTCLCRATEMDGVIRKRLAKRRAV
ncbi:MAG: glycosyltransferase [Humidesulfovibrio sp.]|nr:glycosyltransferase [Humidesulfovibrio sp.]